MTKCRQLTCLRSCSPKVVALSEPGFKPCFRQGMAIILEGKSVKLKLASAKQEYDQVSGGLVILRVSAQGHEFNPT